MVSGRIGFAFQPQGAGFDSPRSQAAALGIKIPNTAETLKGQQLSDSPGAFCGILESRPVRALGHVCSLTQEASPSYALGCLAESRNKNRIQIELAANGQTVQ